MASGDTIYLLHPLAGVAPAASPAGLVWVPTADTPAGNVPVLTFPDGSDAWMYWFFTMPAHYDGGGFTISWKGGTDNTSTGTLELEVRMVVLADAVDLNADHTLDSATAVALTDTPPATPADKLNYSATGTLSHANAGSPTGGTSWVGVSAYRDYTTDTNTGTMQVAEILITET